MDDTICEFTKAKEKALKVNPYNKYPQSECDFFRSLKPVPHAIDSLKIIKNRYNDVWLLTRPSYKNPWSYTEKVLWVRDYLGEEWLERLIFIPDKALVKGDYLIDDQPWPNFEGRQLVFGSKQYPDWSSILNKLKNSIKNVIE